jgi:immune inhibitor A
MKTNSKYLAIGLFLLILIGCGCCSLITGYFIIQSKILKVNINLNTQTPDIQVHTADPKAATSAVTENTETVEKIEGDNPFPNLDAEGTLNTLKNTYVPEKILSDLVKRYKNITISPKADHLPAKKYQIGDRRNFWVLNTQTNAYRKINAKLYFETPHLYFWAAEEIPVDVEAIANLSRTFEDKIYPVNREFFGSESSPGIDNNPHIFLLYAHGLGNAAGFFSSDDTVSPDINEYSNNAEMFYLSGDYVANLDSENAFGVIAHEFQHLIQYSNDKNEVSWISEGFSELAVYLNGYKLSGFDYVFAYNPNLQLTFWPGNDQGDSTPHYGAAFMFLKYFLDRFGENVTKALVAQPANDLDSVDIVLKDLNIIDPVTKKPVTANDVFRDWSVTNLLQDNSVSDGRYQYKNYSAPSFLSKDLLDTMKDWQEGSVKQYGTQYYKINCVRDCTLKIKGQPLVKVLPENPHSGNYYVWSNRGDESDIRLSQEFDFTQVKQPLTLRYWTWYDIENDYDYLYLIASVDNVEWKILKTPSCTKSNPTGANYGCGYSGKSNRWIEESVDLTQFAGKKVILQFEYITDLAVNGEGFVLDDVSIPEIGYNTDFENDLSGWTATGFARIQNQLPQKYLMTLISKGQKTEVQTLELEKNQSLSIHIPANDGIDEKYLVISGSTRYTQIPATFDYRLLSLN